MCWLRVGCRLGVGWEHRRGQKCPQPTGNPLATHWQVDGWENAHPDSCRPLGLDPTPTLPPTDPDTDLDPTQGDTYALKGQKRSAQRQSNAVPWEAAPWVRCAPTRLRPERAKAYCLSIRVVVVGFVASHLAFALNGHRPRHPVDLATSTRRPRLYPSRGFSVRMRLLSACCKGGGLTAEILFLGKCHITSHLDKQDTMTAVFGCRFSNFLASLPRLFGAVFFPDDVNLMQKRPFLSKK